MKAGDSVLKRCLVLSLMVAYLVIGVTYLFFLPKYSPLRPSSSYRTVESQLVVTPAKRMGYGTRNMVVLLHHAYKSTIDTKRELLNTPFKKGTFISALIFGVGSLLILSQGIKKYVKNFHYLPGYVYLSCRFLRI